ncbi:MAG: hypothetical protein ACE5HM_08785, partial [Acidiferrobacterales bacterium]
PRRSIASNGVLIVFLGLPLADSSLNLRFAMKLMVLVCAVLLALAAGTKKACARIRAGRYGFRIRYPLRHPV